MQSRTSRTGDAPGTVERADAPAPRARSGDYRAARIAAALSLTGALVVLLVVDALSAEYEASPLMATILGVVILTLLGLEARDLLRKLAE